jgi:hypothetical protein
LFYNTLIEPYMVECTLNTKIALAIAVTSVIVAVALAPVIISSADAARETTCTNGGGQVRDCDSAAANCSQTKAGRGGGSGEIKGSTADVPACTN